MMSLVRNWGRAQPGDSSGSCGIIRGDPGWSRAGVRKLWPASHIQLGTCFFVQKVLSAPSCTHSLRTVHGGFRAVAAVCISCNRDSMTCKATHIYDLTFYRESVLTSGLGCPKWFNSLLWCLGGPGRLAQLGP